MILNVICETSFFLQMFLFLKILRRLLFLILPIVLIIVIIIKVYKNIVNNGNELKQELQNVRNKLIAIVIIFLVPTIVNIIMNFMSVDVKDSYKTCLENATVEKISYYSNIEEEVSEIKDFIISVKRVPTLENLALAEEKVSDLYGVANGTIIEDLEYQLADLRTQITMTQDEFDCKRLGGRYEDNTCKYPEMFSISDTGMSYYTFKNKNDYVVVSTKADVQKYYKYVRNARICQRQSIELIYHDQCLCFAEEHVHGLVTGEMVKPASQVQQSYYSGFKSFSTDDKSEILKVIYSELTSNRPVIIHVNGNSSGTSRHYVAAVGFKSTVTGPSALTDSDLLLIDSYDCEMEQLHDWGTSRFLTTGRKCGKKDYSGYQVYMLK